MSRGQRIAYFTLPMAFCLAVHFIALRTWFYSDDFAWLGLPLDLQHNSIWHVLFAPEAQGTMRWLSERAYFLVFTSIFGIEAPPFRIWAFLTQFASIALLMGIARRLTGSRVAAFLAPILWVANAALAEAMGWSSAYNEIAFAFFILSSFYLLLLYLETGQRKYWIWQWVVFLLGFGALELNVVYPVLAAAFALACAPQIFRRTLWLFVPSIAYTALHFAVVTPSDDPNYKMIFDGALPVTLWNYWAFAWGAMRPAAIDWRPVWLGFLIALAVTVALVWFAVEKARSGNRTGLFLLAWFLAVIAPLLPLKNHFTEYYLTVPVIGICILGAWAMSEARGVWIGAAAVLAAAYFTVSLRDSFVTERYWYNRAHQMKYLITAMQALPKDALGKKILLAGIDNDFFWSGFDGDPFRLLGIRDIYLAPGTEKSIDAHPEWGGISRWVISTDAAYDALTHKDAMAYELVGRNLRDVTPMILPMVAAEHAAKHPEIVDVGNAAMRERVGREWYPIEDGYRWMAKSATIKIAAPTHPGQGLEVEGYCPAMLLTKGPIEASFRAGGVAIGKITVSQADQAFHGRLALPDSLVGKQTMQVEISVNRTTVPATDKRELGLIFGTFTMK